MRTTTRTLTVLAATTAVLWLAAGPASALTLTLPTLPPLPVPVPVPPVTLPVGASVSGGTGGQPVDVTVTVPGSSIGVKLPGGVTLSTTPVTVPVLTPTTESTTSTTPVTTSDGAAPVSPSPVSSSPVSSSPGSARSDGPHSSSTPNARNGPAASSTDPGSPAIASADAAVVSGTGGRVTGEIPRRAPATFIATLPDVAARVALWAGLALAVFMLQAAVRSALTRRREHAARTG